MDDLGKSVQYIKGVGPARFKLLNRLGIYTLQDLLYYFPRRYEDRRQFTPISQLEEGSFATIKGEIVSLQQRLSKKRLSIFQIVVEDESGRICAVWFNQPFMGKYFKSGLEIILYGKVERYQRLQINSPEFEFVSQKESFIHMGRIVPVYRLTARLNQRYLRSIISKTAESSFTIPDMLPYSLRTRLGLLPLTLALRYIHFPQDFKLKEQAYRRLVFDEFFLLQLILALKRAYRDRAKTALVHRPSGKLIGDFLQRVPFQLTADQKKVIAEIKKDMRAARPMSRLLQGDVGSGKTIVAAYALALSVQSGFQAALMAPTEILAEQHYFTLSNLFAPLDINIGILISSMNSSAKANTLQETKSGEIDVLVGTHSLIEENLEFKKLGLVIIDEQHKFGLTQRLMLRQKGLNPDCLIMSATPIPRTLAMTVYGDLDISTIKELPKGRLPISTLRVKESAIKNVYNFIREEVARGRQAYIVYPLIKRGKTFELKTATEMYNRLKQEEFHSLNLGLVHGQMDGRQKEKVMQDFKQQRLNILVSTTVIEVGIDVPNASVMVIENAQQFGLSQLHQLRGRIGRGRHRSYCILVSGPLKTEKAKRRIEAMLQTQDGFRLAEQDLDIRGPGQVFGPAQHGLPELKIGDIVRDMQILELARQEAFSLVKADPHLKASQNSLIRQRLKEKFSTNNINLLSV